MAVMAPEERAENESYNEELKGVVVARARWLEDAAARYGSALTSSQSLFQAEYGQALKAREERDAQARALWVKETSDCDSTFAPMFRDIHERYRKKD